MPGGSLIMDKYSGDEDESNSGWDWTTPLDVSHTSKPVETSSCNSKQWKEESQLGHSRTIVHIDIDCFYAQVEMIHQPHLQNKPLGIVQKSLVITTNYIARDMGVPKHCRVKEVKQVCPDIVLINGEDLTKYRKMSYQITECLQKYSGKVERLGFDENFIDISELVAKHLTQPHDENIKGHIYGEKIPAGSSCECGCYERIVIGSQIAAEMREDLFKTLGITSCAGTAWNKLMAKLVGTKHKPNQQTAILPSFARQLLVELPSVRSITGIGWTTAKKLQETNIQTVADLQDVSVDDLCDVIGSRQLASRIKELSIGVDDSPVMKSGKPKSISEEDVYYNTCSCMKDVTRNLNQLLQDIYPRLLEDGRIAHTVRLTVRQKLQSGEMSKRESRQCPLPTRIARFLTTPDCSDDVKTDMLRLLEELFSKMVERTRPYQINLFNVCFTNFEAARTKGSIESFLDNKSPEIHSDDKRVNNPPSTTFAVEIGKGKNRNSTVLDRWMSGVNKAHTKRRNYIELDLNDESNKKRIRISPGATRENQCGSSTELYRNSSEVPDGVDKDVFNALPHDIQQDILRGPVGSSSVSCHETVTTSVVTAGNGSSGNSDLPASDSSSGNAISLDSSRTSVKDIPIARKDDRFDISSSTTEDYTKEGGCDDFNIPPSIDRTVFKALPHDIQCEIIKQYHATPSGDLQANNFKKFKGKAEQNSGILKYFKK